MLSVLCGQQVLVNALQADMKIRQTKMRLPDFKDNKKRCVHY